ncbi:MULTISPECIES: hypothetical protein [Oceanimonas]|uniref:Oxidoreductase molybdopterin-binding domain-containing protein n=1 Tax=Oceanimonas doudoroffii TaxID=84158 RepID=A0A233RFZ9_9GAMM|nr:MULTISPECIES: hypothetical protein [Oceanimonas]NHI01844.1 hypothetical protein [Oceanimonas sp. MB9]OXY82311.1 hypothetical protein B6S08_01905 [Oceanimonas doudoroffii]
MRVTTRFANACFAILSALLMLLPALPVKAADPLPPPDGRVVLTVTGNLAHTNDAGQARLDMDLLASLPQHEFSTLTPWTDGKHEFRGVLLNELLQRLGADGKRVRLVALNDYHHDIDMALVRNTPFLLATHLDGKRMKVRDKGPLWLMLPLSESKEYDTKRYHEMLVWQLKSLDIQ